MTTDKVMRSYEALIVLNPELGEADLKTEVNRLKGFIESLGGMNVSPDIWGKKQLAYSSKKFQFGWYVTLPFAVVDTDIPAKLSQQLRLEEKVLKFQTHRVGERKRKFKGNPKAKPQVLGGDDLGLDADY